MTAEEKLKSINQKNLDRVNKHIKKQKDKGLVLVKVWIKECNKQTLKELAEELKN